MVTIQITDYSLEMDDDGGNDFGWDEVAQELSEWDN